MIFDRLGKIDRHLAAHSATMEGEIALVGQKIHDLDERVRIQNGRVTKAEYRLNELETHRKIYDHHAEEDKAKSEWWKDRQAAIAIGTLLAVIGGVIGHVL
jgi:hypothetical protein